jgi:hypothetical protein
MIKEEKKKRQFQIEAAQIRADIFECLSICYLTIVSLFIPLPGFAILGCPEA